MRPLLTVMAFCMLFGVFGWAIAKELRIFYRRTRIAYADASIRTRS